MKTKNKKSFKNRTKKTCLELMKIREDYITVVTPVKRKVNNILRVVGIICLVIAIFPNALGFIFYPLAFALLGISMKDLIKYKRDKVRGLRTGSTYRYYQQKFLILRNNDK